MKGFTLIELMIVIAVTGVVLAIAGAKFDTYLKDDAVDKAAYKMKYDITHIQNLKISDTRDYKILIDNNNKTYTCFRDDDGDDIPDNGEILQEPATKGPMTYRFANGGINGSPRIFNDVELSRVEIFDSTGASALSGGTVVLFIDRYGALRVDNGGVYRDLSSNLTSRIVLSIGGFSRTLILYPLTTDINIR